QTKGGANYCSPLLMGDHLYWISGEVHCLNAKTGEVVYEKRLYEDSQEYVSPVAVDGRIYALTRRSGLFVFKAGAQFELLAQNRFDGDNSFFNASPAISDGQVLVRSNAYLYSIGRN